VSFTTHIFSYRRFVLPPTFILLLAGCTTYHARPITQSAVDAALKAPDFAAVRVEAGKLKNPLLAPLELDLHKGFTPDELGVVAVMVSPQLRALRDQRGVARAQVVQAGLLPNPQLSYSMDRPSGNTGVAGLVTGQTFGLAAELTALIGRSDRVAGAKATADALDLDVAWQEWQVAQDTRLRAYRVLSLERRLPLLRAIEKDMADNLAAERKGFDRNLTTGDGLVAATAAWRQAQSDRLAAEQALADDRAALRLVLNLPPTVALPLRPAPERFVAISDASDWLTGLEDRRLDLVALRLGYKSQEAAVRAAVKAQFPRIGLALSRANDTSNVRTVSAGVTIDLPIFDRNQAGIASARATRKQLFDEYVARVAEARSSVVELLARLSRTHEQLVAADAALPALKQRAEASKRALADGVVDAVSARAAQADWASQRVETLRMRQDVFELNVALEIASGRPGEPTLSMEKKP